MRNHLILEKTEQHLFPSKFGSKVKFEMSNETIEFLQLNLERKITLIGNTLYN